MECTKHLLIFSLFIAIQYAHAKKYEPMVAFICNKGTMHTDPSGEWTADTNTDCLSDKTEILNYCKTMYPSLDVTNIVESTEESSISGWCSLSSRECDYDISYNVRSYRCLTGTFESDALIVPRNCAFDHIHDEEKCQSFAYWEDVATQSCGEVHQKSIKSFAMLLPCAVDQFSGVEFVCCPQGQAGETTKPADVGKPKIDVMVKVPDTKTDVTTSAPDVVQKYMHMRAEPIYENEHAVYQLVHKQAQKANEEQITKLMSEWADTRKRIQSLKEKDPNGAASLNSDMSSRFQKQYFSVQAEGDSKSVQLDAVHQQHVQTNFNYKKRQSMQKLMEQLGSDYYNTPKILEALKNYIEIEKKDAKHCIKHFNNIREKDSWGAQELLPATIEHLTLINTRINQSIELLDTLEEKDIIDELKTNIREWLKNESEFNLEETVSGFKRLLKNNQPTTNLPQFEIEVKVEKAAEPEDSGDDENMYRKYAEQLSQTEFGKGVSDVEIEGVLIEDPILVTSEPAVEYLEDMDQDYGLSATAITAIVCGCLGTTVIIMLAILVVRKRAQYQRPYTNTYLQVSTDSPDLSPEDRHIAAMQNGYENPTYKFLEQIKA